MLSREGVVRVCDPVLRKRQNKQWYRAWHGTVRTGAGYEYPCWSCGEIGMIGVDGFGSKQYPIRPRNIQHVECWNATPPELMMLYRIRDTRHIIYRAEKRRSQRSYNREAIRQRRLRNGYTQPEPTQET